MLRLLFLYCTMSIVVASSTAGAQSLPASVADAVSRGMAYANARTLQWKTDKGCATCHHAPMSLCVLNACRKRNVAIDETFATSLRDWLQAKDDRAGFFPADTLPADQRGALLGAAYSLIALASGPAEQADTAFVTRVATYFAGVQESDGSWVIASTKGRPPIFAGPGVTTRIIRLALGLFPWAANGDPGEPDVVAADAWLAENPPLTQQEVALELMLAVRLAKSDSIILECAENLLSLQNTDGGWSQTPGMASDAYATGQALAALGTAARNASSDERIARGVQFLLSSQKEDGSWSMLTRPTQGKDGEPFPGTEPITMAGTTWALLGLVRAGL